MNFFFQPEILYECHFLALDSFIVVASSAFIYENQKHNNLPCTYSNAKMWTFCQTTRNMSKTVRY